jgi:hypothetical protein
MSRLPPEAFAILALLGFACLSAMLALCAAPIR